MRNVLDLFNEVCDVLQQVGIDPAALLDFETEACKQASQIKLMGAIQPAWPLAKNIRGLALLEDGSNRDEDEDEDEDRQDEDSDLEDEDPKLTCWITLEDTCPYNMNPYAPKRCWDF